MSADWVVAESDGERHHGRHRLLAGVSASDNCGSATVTNNYTGLSDGCGLSGSVTATFTATDACGDQSSCTNTVTVADTVAPIINTCPTASYLGCNPAEANQPAKAYYLQTPAARQQETTAFGFVPDHFQSYPVCAIAVAGLARVALIHKGHLLVLDVEDCSLSQFPCHCLGAPLRSAAEEFRQGAAGDQSIQPNCQCGQRFAGDHASAHQ